MPINANLKAQVQARINAASNGSTLEELWNLKLIARGLECNESNIDNLIELRLNEFGVSTELKSLLQGALSVRPYAQNIVWKTQTFLTSGTFTRPAKMVGDTVWATGCAAGGSGGNTGGSGFICGGFGGTYCQNRPITLPDGQNSFSVLIPAGGAATTSSTGNPGGDLVFDTLLTLRGGRGGFSMGSDGYPLLPYDLADRLGTCAGVNPLLIFQAKDSSRWESPCVILPPTLNGNRAGGSSTSSNVGYYLLTGGAPGLYGSGTNASSGGASAAAGNNTGAGSGASQGGSGPGGSGRLDLGWWEYE